MRWDCVHAEATTCSGAQSRLALACPGLQLGDVPFNGNRHWCRGHCLCPSKAYPRHRVRRIQPASPATRLSLGVLQGHPSAGSLL